MLRVGGQLWVVGARALWSAEVSDDLRDVDFDALAWERHEVEVDGPLLGGISWDLDSADSEWPVVVFTRDRVYRVDPSGLTPLGPEVGPLLDAVGSMILIDSGGWLSVRGDELKTVGVSPEPVVSAGWISDPGGQPHYRLIGTPDGRVIRINHNNCPHGRPWVVDGRTRVAGVARGSTDPAADSRALAWLAESGS